MEIKGQHPEYVRAAWIEARSDHSADHVGIRAGGRYTCVDRADFLAAVASELNVRIVSLDAIVVERSAIPGIKRVSPGSYVLDTGGSWHMDPEDETAEQVYEGALEHLALAEYLDANPPVDEAQVESLTAVLIDLAVEDPDSADTLARQLVARGVRVDGPRPLAAWEIELLKGAGDES